MRPASEAKHAIVEVKHFALAGAGPIPARGIFARLLDAVAGVAIKCSDFVILGRALHAPCVIVCG